jgi:AcrR family transcriptional regulator
MYTIPERQLCSDCTYIDNRNTWCIVPIARGTGLAKRIARGGIVAAAAVVFARQGFASARVEDILAAAGIARRTFYKYFESKEDVLAALYEVATAELLASISRASGDNLDAVRAALDAYLDYHVENAALVKVLTEQAIRSDGPLAVMRRRFRADLVRLLDHAVRTRTGEQHDPMLYAALVSALEGLSLDLLVDDVREETPRDVARAKQVMHLILDRVLLARL